MTRLLVFVLAALLALPVSAMSMVRIKDIASLQGVRDNQLVGYGLVIGLKGSGDTLRNSPFTEQSLQSMLDSLGVNVRDARLRTRNVAAVVVTAEMPSFIGQGSTIDVSVSSLGDATSLAGGPSSLPLYWGLMGRSTRSRRAPLQCPVSRNWGRRKA